MAEIVSSIMYPFFGGIWNAKYEHIGDGGPRCAAYLTIPYKVMVMAVWVPLQLYSFFKHYKYCKEDYEQMPEHIKNKKPSTLEKITGYFLLAIELLQCYYKFTTGRGAFMLNPCHVAVALQIYVLLTKKTLLNDLLFRIMVTFTFGDALGFLMPDTNGLDLPFEAPMFYVEHFAGGFVGPAVVILSGRYSSPSYVSLKSILFGWSINSLWNRAVLIPIGMITWTNLNFALCPSPADPWYGLVGTWYLFVGDFTVGGPSILYHWGVYKSFSLIRSLVAGETSPAIAKAKAKSN
jgi:hypothetical protein